MCLEIAVGSLDTKSGLSLCLLSSYTWELISQWYSHLSEVLSRPEVQQADPSAQSQMGAADSPRVVFSGSRESPLMPGISPTNEIVPPCSY